MVLVEWHGFWVGLPQLACMEENRWAENGRGPKTLKAKSSSLNLFLGILTLFPYFPSEFARTKGKIRRKGVDNQILPF